jgi:hypothetical protein
VSVLKEPPPVKFFLAAYSGDQALLSGGPLALARGFRDGALGDPDILSLDLPMPDGGYYGREMGPGLVKRYLSFPGHLPPDALVDLKIAAMAEESRSAEGGRRRLNLDPGYVFAGGLVLSTGKPAGHRLYLGRGVWGELTLMFQAKAFRALPWTYPDYLDPRVQGALLLMREAYFRKEREGRRD